jgi:uncharacterized membrane protein YeaQ/YmgE (transglycosylase-associated protein family)
MFHLISYVIVGFIAGLVARSIMHLHLPLLWTVLLGVVGSVVAGFITHLFMRPRVKSSFHPAGIIFSILGALLAFLLWTKLNLHLPAG